VNYIPRKAAIVAHNQAEADFAESMMTSYGMQVSRFESTQALSRSVQSQFGVSEHAATPDIAILVGSTSDFTAAVGELAELMPCVVTSSTTSVSDAVELMKRGAKDVVELPCGREELWQRVSTALEESNGEAARNAMMAEMRARLEHLTPAENEVIEAMLDGLANKQIAQRLSIGLRTVELRRSKIMRKMQAKSVAELVKFICMSGRLCSRGAPTDS
jgi:FixJ family two-component response regulator